MVSPPSDSSTGEKLSPRFDLLAGGISGGVTRFFVAPLDVVKIRFQVQVEPTHLSSQQAAVSKVVARAKYHSVGQTIRTIIREEGLSALWKGNLTATFLWISYGAVQFATYQQVVQLLGDRKAESVGRSGVQVSSWERVKWSLSGGGTAGAVATFATYPLDLVRTRLAAQSEPKTYKGMGDAFWKIVQSGGVTGLYRGLFPTLLEIVPYIAIQFMVYEETKLAYAFIRKKFGGQGEEVGALGHLWCGAVAGTVSKIIVLPLDTLKKRLQISGFERGYGENVSVNGILDCARKIFQREGWKGFYKGTVPSLYKAAPAAALTFATYEQAKKVLLWLSEPTYKGNHT